MKMFIFLIIMTVLCGVSFVNAQLPVDAIQSRFRIPFPKPKDGHTKNARPSTQGKHEKGDARRQREQEKAQEKREQSRKRYVIFTSAFVYFKS